MTKKIIIVSLAVAVFLSAATIVWAANGGYSAWRSAVGNRAPFVNERNFDRFNEMHKLMADGDYVGAEKIRSELGFGSRGGCAMHRRGGGRGANGGCQMANSGGGVFADKNNNGICDYHENLK